MQHISDPKAANVNIPAQTPTGRMYLQGLQDNITNLAETKILLNAIDADFTDGIEDVANHWIFPEVAGYYSYHASMFWSGMLADKHYDLTVHFGHTGAENIIARANVAGNATIPQLGINISGILLMDNLDHIFISCNHNDGTNNPDIVSTSPKTFLALQRVR